MRYSQDSVEFDFIQDWYQHARRILQEGGYKNIPAADVECSIAFFECLRRRVPARPRRVEVAPEFSVPLKHQRAFETLRSKLECGDDVTPYMSRTIMDAGKKDPLLNDWRVQHFHLGDRPHPKKPGFVAGTKEIALAWVDSEAVYFIKMGSHGRDVGNATWGDAEILNILDRRWPHLLAQAAIPPDEWGVDVRDDGEPDPTPDEIVMMRKFMTIKKLPSGRILLPPGGGNMCSGNSSEALRFHDRILTRIHDYHQWVGENVHVFLARCTLQGATLQRPVRLHLRFEEGWNAWVEAVDANGNRASWTGFSSLAA